MSRHPFQVGKHFLPRSFAVNWSVQCTRKINIHNKSLRLRDITQLLVVQQEKKFQVFRCQLEHLFNHLVSNLSALSPNSQCVRASQEHSFIVQAALRVSSEFVWSLVQISQTPHVNNFCYRRLYCQTRRT